MGGVLGRLAIVIEGQEQAWNFLPQVAVTSFGARWFLHLGNGRFLAGWFSRFYMSGAAVMGHVAG